MWFLEVDTTELVPQLHHLLPMRPWARYLTSVGLNCLICAKGTIRVPKASGCHEKYMKAHCTSVSTIFLTKDLWM